MRLKPAKFSAKCKHSDSECILQFPHCSLGCMWFFFPDRQALTSRCDLLSVVWSSADGPTRGYAAVSRRHAPSAGLYPAERAAGRRLAPAAGRRAVRPWPPRPCRPAVQVAPSDRDVGPRPARGRLPGASRPAGGAAASAERAAAAARPALDALRQTVQPRRGRVRGGRRSDGQELGPLDAHGGWNGLDRHACAKS